MKSSPTREAILEAACTLFYQQGIHTTSIDAILEKAGVARQSLYLHFSSKDGLIAEFLRVRDERWRGWMRSYIQQASDAPSDQLLAVFDFLAAWFAEPEFNGCAFINTTVEYSDPQHPFRALITHHKQLVQEEILSLCRAAGFTQANTLACHLALLMEGAIVTEQVSSDSQAAQQAKQIASLLIAQQSGYLNKDKPS